MPTMSCLYVTVMFLLLLLSCIEVESSSQIIGAIHQPVSPQSCANVEDINALFARHGIREVYSEEVDLPLSKLTAYWVHEKVHRDFLLGEGDEDILTDPWQPRDESSILAEDELRLPYRHQRSFNFSHPRTTFLFVGPKLAGAQQIQYFYSNTNASPSDAQRASSVIIVTTITQFKGFPMADQFRVVQYWTLSSKGNKTIMKVGVKVHFIVTPLWPIKGQIVSGTEAEIKLLSVAWTKHTKEFAKTL